MSRPGLLPAPRSRWIQNWPAQLHPIRTDSEHIDRACSSIVSTTGVEADNLFDDIPASERRMNASRDIGGVAQLSS
ncbi:hypothetical protein BJI47_17770 [Rhodococcus sp. 1168]|nr:hypothetical protein BJI47_17770 [Rhodococcus sp. 1168]